jgi:GNAT superfamily N-acetyltransferase
MENGDARLQISTELARLDVGMIYRFLSEESTWAVGIGRDVVERAIDNSLCFGAYLEGRQVGFARVISDYATFANLVDVFVLPEYRRRGISKHMMETVMAHSSLQGLRRFTLATFDAHGLYRRFGFTAPGRPELLMEKYFPNLYLS